MAGRYRLQDYKRCGLNGVVKNRRQQADERRVLRDQRRSRAIDERRGLLFVEDVETVDKKRDGNSRLMQLQAWKEKKQQQTRKEAGIKPAFLVGKIKYNDNHLYRPPESSTFKAPKGLKPLNPVTSQRILRSQTKPGSSRIVERALKDFASAMQSRANVKMVTPKQKSGPSRECISDEGEDFNRMFDVIPLVRGEEEGNALPEISNNAANRVVMSCGSEEEEEVVPKLPQSGKKTERRSRRTKKSVKILSTIPEQKFDGSIPVDTATGQSSEPSVLADTDCAKPGDYFRSLHKEAVEKLAALCSEWNSVKDEVVPGDVNDSIDVAVGYAKLLMSQKLRQFENLICEHEDKTDGTQLEVLSSDLEAFWNLVNIEVLNIYGKFHDLKVLKENNWMAETVQTKKRNKTVPIASKKAKVHATSGMRSFIAQARKKALLGDKENNPQKSVLDGVMEEQQMGMAKPMSPAVMRVAAMAKGLGSPKRKTPSQEGSALQNSNKVAVFPQTPVSVQKTPGRRKKISRTPDVTPLRRSARISRV